MELLDIKRAFEKKIIEITPVSIDSSFENASFTPSKDKPYQVIQILPRTPENPSFGDNYFREVGEVQLILCFPLNKGTADAYTHAGLIRDTFFRGFSMTENGTIVTVKLTPRIQGSIILDDRFCVPVNIEYFASILKN